MPIRVVRYRRDGTEGWGVVRDGRVTPIEGAYPSTRDFMQEGVARARSLGDERPGAFELAEVELDRPRLQVN